MQTLKEHSTINRIWSSALDQKFTKKVLSLKYALAKLLYKERASILYIVYYIIGIALDPSWHHQVYLYHVNSMGVYNKMAKDSS